MNTLKNLSDAEIRRLTECHDKLQLRYFEMWWTMRDMLFNRKASRQETVDVTSKLWYPMPAMLHELGALLVDFREQMGEETLKAQITDRTAIPWDDAEEAMNFVLDSEYGRRIQSILDELSG
jgi:hypothetical protein